MCGIFGFTSEQKLPASIILEGIKSLEYRGYDSWGIAVLGNKSLKSEKHVGKIGEAKTKLPKSNTGMGHTRWATHGGVTKKNAHPHLDCNKRFAIIHNGIIENEKVLRSVLKDSKHKIVSQTDSELIAHIFEEATKKNGTNSLFDAASEVVNQLKGSFAIGVIDQKNPKKIVLARMGGPLVIGISENTTYFASDPSALLKYTKDVIYLKDGEIAYLTPKNVEIRSFKNNKKRIKITKLDWEIEQAEKDGYEHFMLKEIYEQPESITNSMRGRVDKKGNIKLGGLERVSDVLETTKFIRFVAAGTASYAALFGKHILSELTDINGDYEVASELAYKKVNWPKNSIAWYVSQSGETADILQAMKKVKKSQAASLGLVNVVGSTITRNTIAGVYLHAGPEVAVASTKAFTSQLVCLLLINCWLSQNQKTSSKMLKESMKVAKELVKLPKSVAETLKLHPQVKRLAKKIANKKSISFFGRGVYYPIALEGALKLKEVSYVDAVGLQTGELKHGPIACMDKDRPAVVLIPDDALFEKSLSNINELKAREIPIYAVTNQQRAKEVEEIADVVISIPKMHPLVMPVLFAVVVQLLAYEAAKILKAPIDKPRNLAKSVTVE